MQHTQDFFSKAQKYTDLFSDWTKKFSPPAIADHICYKCESSEEFEYLRRLFENESEFIYQSIISKRRIAIVKFKNPLATSLGDIWYLELSDQKSDGSQGGGFDHIEIYPKEGTMKELAKILEEKGMTLEKIERPHHTTYDGIIAEHFKIRLEPESLIEKIKEEEMK
jgi:predicted metalloenzyme YecM